MEEEPGHSCKGKAELDTRVVHLCVWERDRQTDTLGLAVLSRLALHL